MARTPVNPWREIVRLAELGRKPLRRTLQPDAAQRAALAPSLGVGALDAFTADVTVTPWLDGAEVEGRFEARVTQTCGVTLELFEQPVSGTFKVRVLPAGSPNLPANEEGEEIELDPDADDPPDVTEDGEMDLAAYAAEHLALEIDPFPRKPGAVFEPPEPGPEASPFAVLRRLKPDDPTN